MTRSGWASRAAARRGPGSAVIAARVSGELRDLAAPLADGDSVEPVEVGSDDGRAIMRHSTAHVMAQAVQELFPEAKLGIGPPVENGFYYDFDVPAPFSPEDLKAIEQRMRQIVKQGQRFSRREVSDDQAREELAGEPYKLELIGIKGGAADLLGSRGPGRTLRGQRRGSRRGRRQPAHHLRQPRPGHRRGMLEGPVPRAARAHHPADPGVQADALQRGVLAGE